MKAGMKSRIKSTSKRISVPKAPKATRGRQGIQSNVKQNLASGTRGTKYGPVGGRKTVGKLESLVGQARKKMGKKK